MKNTFSNSRVYYKVILILLLNFCGSYSVFAHEGKDSIDYHKIKEAMVCFDCINQNQEMLRQVITNLEKLDSNKISILSRGTYFQDLSMAFSLLVSDELEYLSLTKEYAFRAMFYSNHYDNYWQIASLYQRENKCDSMNNYIQQYRTAFPKDNTIDNLKIDELKLSCP